MLDAVKPVFLLAYGCFGIFLILSAARVRTSAYAVLRPVTGVLFALCAALNLLRLSMHGLTILACALCATVLIAFRNGSRKSLAAVPAVLAVITCCLSLAWWFEFENQPFALWRIAAFALSFWLLQNGFSREAGTWAKASKIISVVLCVVFGAGGLLLLTDTTPYTPRSQALVFLAHHHGAYIGSALHVMAGLVPFYDVPLQYGLGPTLSIVAACRISGCWTGLDFLTAITTLLMGFAILGMALTGSRARGAGWRIAAFAAVFAAVFLWPGFPNLGAISAATPSVGGLRFLPVTAVAFFLFFGRPRVAAVTFIAAVLWSPESAVMTIAVYGIHETARLGFVRAALKTAGLTAGSYAGLVLIHRLTYGVWMEPSVMAEYILHVPGPLPIDPFTAVLLLALALALSGWMVARRHTNDTEFRRDLLVSSLLFAATSYYLGRSHPNNVCNLMPFLMLVGLRAIGGGTCAAAETSPVLSRLTIGAVSTATAAIVLSTWVYVPFGQLFLPRPGPVVEAVAALEPGINEVRARIVNPDHLGIADFASSLNRHPAETIVWTPMDPDSLWAYVPAERRKLYIRRSAERLKRGGWVIVEGDRPEILNEFRVAYKVTQQATSEYGKSRYTVALLTPLAAPELVAASTLADNKSRAKH